MQFEVMILGINFDCRINLERPQ